MACSREIYSEAYLIYVPLVDVGTSHLTTDFPDLAIVHCKAGLLAAKASQKQEAIDSFYSALSIEPLLWEAWLGLCNLGEEPRLVACKKEILKARPL